MGKSTPLTDDIDYAKLLSEPFQMSWGGKKKGLNYENKFAFAFTFVSYLGGLRRGVCFTSRSEYRIPKRAGRYDLLRPFEIVVCGMANQCGGDAYSSQRLRATRISALCSTACDGVPLWSWIQLSATGTLSIPSLSVSPSVSLSRFSKRNGLIFCMQNTEKWCILRV